MAKTNGAAKHQVAPVIRGAFLRGLKLHEDKTGLTFSEIMQQEIEQHGVLHVMDRVSKFTERVTASDINHNHAGEVTLVEAILRASELAARPSSDRDTQVAEQPSTVRH